MNSAPPKNSTRSISGPPLGTRRLSASPAKNAPTMPSMPPSSATNDADRNAARTKMNRSARSWPMPAKNQRARKVRTNAQYTASTPRPDEKRDVGAEAALARGAAGHHREDEQRERVGDDRRPDRRRDRGIGGDPEALHDRVHHERVRRPQRADEDRRGQVEAEPARPDEPERHRQGEREQPELDRRLPEPREHVEVELEPGQEHEVQQADLAQRVDGRDRLQQPEPGGADEEPAQQEPDDPRQAEPLRDERAEQDDREQQQQVPDQRARLVHRPFLASVRAAARLAGAPIVACGGRAEAVPARTTPGTLGGVVGRTTRSFPRVVHPGTLSPWTSTSRPKSCRRSIAPSWRPSRASSVPASASSRGRSARRPSARTRRTGTSAVAGRSCGSTATPRPASRRPAAPSAGPSRVPVSSDTI